MVQDNWRRALTDAKDFLDNAKTRDKSSRVRISNLVHAVIRANDALLLNYGKDKPRDHEHAAQDFNQLLQEQGLFDKYGRYRKNIADVISEKTPAEYTGKRYSQGEVAKLLKKVKRFTTATEELIRD